MFGDAHTLISRDKRFSGRWVLIDAGFTCDTKGRLETDAAQLIRHCCMVADFSLHARRYEVTSSAALRPPKTPFSS